MFDFLTGTVVSKRGDVVVLDVRGVGYACFVSLNTLADLPPKNETVTLLVHLVVREDELSLYGFLAPLERELFRRLIGVAGVGPKLALALLSGTTPEVLLDAIGNESVARLKAIKGIGAKTAQRIVVDLGDYVRRRREFVASVPGGGEEIPLPLQEEAAAALVALGFTEKAALAAVEKAIRKNKDASVEELVREALGGGSE